MWRRHAAPLALALLALGGCLGNDWRTDMWYQPSKRPEDMPRPQPEKSVPLDAHPVYFDRDDTADLKDPVPATAASLAHGKYLFANRCAACHGADAHGNGPVSRFFPPAPDLAYQTVVARTDGFIWGTITYGGKAMPSQREGLSIKDRWDLVNFVRQVQGKVRPP